MNWTHIDRDVESLCSHLVNCSFQEKTFLANFNLTPEDLPLLGKNQQTQILHVYILMFFLYSFVGKGVEMAVPTQFSARLQDQVRKSKVFVIKKLKPRYIHF